MTNFINRMLQDIKQKVLEKMRTVKESCIVKDHVYVCPNDGMVCFNGMVAEIVKGCKFADEIDSIRDGITERFWDDQYEYAAGELKQQLLNEGLNPESEEFEKRFNDSMDNYEYQGDYYEEEQAVKEDLAELVTDELREVYENYGDTISRINDVHADFVNEDIEFPEALEKVITILEEDKEYVPKERSYDE